MTHTLPEQRTVQIMRRYLEDQEFLQTHRARDPQRLATISGIQSIIKEFIAGETNLKAFRDRLDAYLRKPEHDLWGTRGFWMMTLNQLINHHDSLAEAQLRTALNGLNAENVGERFEDFAHFLESEKQRLPNKGNKLAAPGRAPFIITLFALWLDPDGGVIVTWPTMREGLRALMDLGALPSATPLARTWDGVRIATAQDYAAARQTLQSIAALEPSVAAATQWWDERFLEWVRQHQQEIPDWIEVEQPDAYVFTDTHLAPIPAAILSQRIARLRANLLVSEDVIRRVYHALVLGQHVILSGPPGTGKTRLATLLPTILWQLESSAGSTAVANYTTRLFTATDEWTPRHVIGGIAPVTRNGQVTYAITYGCLVSTILDNWNLDIDVPASWETPARKTVSKRIGQSETQYRGCWLVIDEFNRAPIDLALGEAMTALGGGDMTLTVPTMEGTVNLPIPKDFRILGTLNTFDRHFLNQISEALKRRFAFIEILPPSRLERAAEQGIVLQTVLRQLQPISSGRIREGGHAWDGVVEITQGAGTDPWLHQWLGDSAIARCFDEGWRLFEVIRLFRQFGTAQAIAWSTHYLGSGLLDELLPDDEAGWRRNLDVALADTLADQLQILFPDELEVLRTYLTTDNASAFCDGFNQVLARISSPQRRGAHILSLQSVKGADGHPLISVPEARALAENESLPVADSVLETLFHANQMRGHLPLLVERLERLLFERNI